MSVMREAGYALYLFTLTFPHSVQSLFLSHSSLFISHFSILFLLYLSICPVFPPLTSSASLHLFHHSEASLLILFPSPHAQTNRQTQTHVNQHFSYFFERLLSNSKSNPELFSKPSTDRAQYFSLKYPNFTIAKKKKKEQNMICAHLKINSRDGMSLNIKIYSL